MKFEIDIDEFGFTASSNGELLASGSSGADLLKIFNQILQASVANPPEVIFKDKGKSQ